MIQVSKKAARALTKALADKPAGALRVFVAGFG